MSFMSFGPLVDDLFDDSDVSISGMKAPWSFMRDTWAHLDNSTSEKYQLGGVLKRSNNIEH